MSGYNNYIKEINQVAYMHGKLKSSALFAILHALAQIPRKKFATHACAEDQNTSGCIIATRSCTIIIYIGTSVEV